MSSNDIEIGFDDALNTASREARDKIENGIRFAHIGCWARVDEQGILDWSNPSALIVIVGNPGAHGEELRTAIDAAIQGVLGIAEHHERSIRTPEGQFTTNAADPVN